MLFLSSYYLCNQIHLFNAIKANLNTFETSHYLKIHIQGVFIFEVCFLQQPADSYT